MNEKTEDVVPVTVKKEVCEPLRGPESPISVLVSVVEEALGCMIYNRHGVPEVRDWFKLARGLRNENSRCRP